MPNHTHACDPRVSSLYARNITMTGCGDIVLAGYGGAGQSIIANILLELGLNYVDPYTEVVHEDGTSTPSDEHAGFRRRMAAVSQRDGQPGSSGDTPRWPRFFKSHLPPEVFAGRRLGGVWLVVRDPRDALHSWYRWRAAFGEEPWDRVHTDFASWITALDYVGRQPAQDWAYFYSTWLNWTAEHRVWACTRFEDLKADPAPVVHSALQALGITVDDARLASAIEASSFEAMRAHEDRAVADGQVFPTAAPPRMMRRGKVNEWQEWMTPELGRPFSHPDVIEIAARLGYSLPPAPTPTLPLLPT